MKSDNRFDPMLPCVFIFPFC